MTIKQAEHEIKRLTSLLIGYDNAYFKEGNSLISDYEYDQLKQTLRELEAKYPQFIQDNSPTQTVGIDLSNKFKLASHNFPMLSLSNTYSDEEVQSFVNRISKAIISDDIEFVCELKFDGIAINLVYEHGFLKQAISRGDGYQGDDVTANIKTISSVPLKIPTDASLVEVRCEVFITKERFNILNQKRLNEGKPLFSNPRNTTAGTIKTLDVSIVAERQLDYYAYGLIEASTTITTHEECIHRLEEWGFNVSPTYKKCKTLDDIKNYIQFWSQEKVNLALHIDGIVIKLNNINQRKLLGSTSSSPRWAIAYKYNPDQVSTKLNSVSYQVGRTGSITPVAELMPVHLAGTVVKRASLHNFGFIKKFDLHQGDTVFIEKGGEIIPKIVGVDLNERDTGSPSVVLISNCPSCGSILECADEQGMIYYCPNHMGCIEQIKGKIIHFASKDAMDIKHLGKQIIDKLMNYGLINNIADIYSLKYEDILDIRGFKHLSSENIIFSIQQSLSMPFDKVLFGMGIRHVGQIASEKLASYFGNIDDITNASFDDFIKVPEIGPKIAQSIVDFFKDESNKELIKRLRAVGLSMAQVDSGIKKTSELDGKVFVISGVFKTIDRNTLKLMIHQNSGITVSSLSKKVDYLVTGDKPGNAKLEKAASLGIKMINEEEVLKLIKK